MASAPTSLSALSDKAREIISRRIRDEAPAKIAEDVGVTLSYVYVVSSKYSGLIKARKRLALEKLEFLETDVMSGLIDEYLINSGRKKVTVTQKVRQADGSEIFEDVEMFVREPQASNKNLELIGKQLGMFINKVDVSLTKKSGVLEIHPVADDADIVDVEVNE